MRLVPVGRWRNLPGYTNAWQNPILPQLRVIATATDGWDHVSVSTMSRCPTWNEMELVKRCFFYPTETAMQLHVPEAEHINFHSYCLHLWRPQHGTIPRPPNHLVGAPSRGA